MPTLIIQNEKQTAGMRLTEQTVIGRLSGNDLVLDAHGISREHARVALHRGHFVIEDIGSTNGTWVNGEQITEPHTLTDGDEIRIGRIQLTYLAADELPAGMRELRRSKDAREHINFRCPSCNKVLQAPGKMAGNKGKCQSCQARFLVPMVTGGTARQVDQPQQPAEEARRTFDAADRVESVQDDAMADALALDDDAIYSASTDLPYSDTDGEGIDLTTEVTAGSDVAYSQTSDDGLDLALDAEADTEIAVADPSDAGDSHAAISVAPPAEDDAQQDDGEPGWDAQSDPLLIGYWLDDTAQIIDELLVAPDANPIEHSFADLGRNLNDDSTFFSHATRDRDDAFGQLDARRGDESIAPSDQFDAQLALDDTRSGLCDVDIHSDRYCVADLPELDGGLVDRTRPDQTCDTESAATPPFDQAEAGDEAMTRASDWWDDAAMVVRKAETITRTDRVAASINRVAKQPPRRRGLIARVQRHAGSRKLAEARGQRGASATGDVDTRPMDQLLMTARLDASVMTHGARLLTAVREGIDVDAQNDLVVLSDHPVPMLGDEAFKRLREAAGRKQRHAWSDAQIEAAPADLLITSDLTMAVGRNDQFDVNAFEVAAVADASMMTEQVGVAAASVSTVGATAGAAALEAYALGPDQSGDTSPSGPIYGYASPEAAMLESSQTLVDSSASRTIHNDKWSSYDPADDKPLIEDEVASPPVKAREPQKTRLRDRLAALFNADQTVPDITAQPEKFERYAQTIDEERRNQLAALAPDTARATERRRVDRHPAHAPTVSPTSTPAAMASFLHLMSRYAGRGGAAVEPAPRPDQTVRRHYKGQVVAAEDAISDTANVVTRSETAPAVAPTTAPMDHEAPDPGSLVQPAPVPDTEPNTPPGESFAAPGDQDAISTTDHESADEVAAVSQAPISQDADAAPMDDAACADAQQPLDHLSSEQQTTDDAMIKENQAQVIDDGAGLAPPPAEQPGDEQMIDWFEQPTDAAAEAASDVADNSHLIDWFAQPVPDAPPTPEQDNSQLVEWDEAPADDHSPPVDQPQVATLAKCTICGSGVVDEDPTVTCPECGTTYHASCWDENLGCASYGCGQVNALAPDQPQPMVAAQPAAMPVAHRPRQFVTHRRIDRGAPWGVIMLVASIFVGALSIISFGLPSAILVIFAGIVRAKHKRRFSKAMFAAVAAINLIACVLGILLAMGYLTTGT